MVGFEFGNDLVSSPPRLPKDWIKTPSPASNAAVGDKWVETAVSAVLKVPSAIVTQEYNYLLNPAHPHFPKITIGKARLLRSIRASVLLRCCHLESAESAQLVFAARFRDLPKAKARIVCIATFDNIWTNNWRQCARREHSNASA